MKRLAKTHIILIIFFTWVVLGICFIFGAVMLAKCSEDVEIKSDGFFQYIVRTGYQHNKNISGGMVVAIVGFTTSGMDQEAIEIPRELDGKPVKYIGYKDEGWYYNNSFHAYSENLRKIYVYDNIENMEFFDGSQVDMMVCSNRLNANFYRDAFFQKIYIYKSLFDSNNYANRFTPANIVFMNNYSEEVNGGYYRLDNIKSGEKIPVPPNPIRSGYEFAGWYREPECINKWDFDMSPTIEDDAEFRLFASWQTK